MRFVQRVLRTRIEANRAGPNITGYVMSVNDRQVGGSHYRTKSARQCWDYIEDSGIGYLEGTAIAYLARHRQKNGVEDLRKARHFVEKLIDIRRKPRGRLPAPDLLGFYADYSMSDFERFAVRILFTWNDPSELHYALDLLDAAIAEAGPDTRQCLLPLEAQDIHR